MNFDDIVDDICDRLNLTSTDALTRIGREVNRYYRRVRTSLGMQQVSREVGASTVTVIGSSTVTFSAVQKVLRVWQLVGTRVKMLDEITWDEMREKSPADGGTPTEWATESQDDSIVTVRLNVEMDEVITLYADGTSTVVDLSGNDIPSFPEDFHDILIEGVLSDEYRKREKMDLARISLDEYERRLSDLRMWMAKSNYLNIRQAELQQNGFKKFTYK